MALETLTARANTGTGTDQLAVVNTAQGKAGAVALVDAGGVLVDGANPVPVEVTNFPATQSVSAAALPLPTGAATDAELSNASGLLQELAIRMSDIADSVGVLMPDVAGRLRVNAEVLGTLSTITTVTTVTTLGTMTNQANVGGYAANQQMIALTLGNEADLRRNIVIT